MGDIDNRMKSYEAVESGRRFMPLLPVCARIDGKCFSSFTKGLNRPFDVGMHRCMKATTKHLVKETNACVGFTESDEITLIWYSSSAKSQIFFAGRIQKMTSILAASASVHFNNMLPSMLPQKANSNPAPVFDCRVWQVPTLTEAANVLVWRELDATRNSVQMAASSVYSNKELFKKNNEQMQDMLMAKGINWNDYPSWFKRGVYILRREEMRAFSTEEFVNLPKNHAARANPSMKYKRKIFETLSMPPIVKVINKEGVLFKGEDCICLSQ